VISTYTIYHEFNESEIVIRKKIITRRVKHDLKDRKNPFFEAIFLVLKGRDRIWAGIPLISPI